MEDRPAGRQCTDVLSAHPQQLADWVPSPSVVGTHGFFSIRAVARLASVGRLPIYVKDLMHRMAASGRVPWVDVDPSGQWQVWWAQRAEIPREVGPRR